MDRDFVMGEDSILDSTEPNGNHIIDTIDPSQISFHRGLHGPVPSRKEQLPIHSHGGLLKATSVLRPYSNSQPSAEDTREDSSEFGSEDMDITPEPSPTVQVRIPPGPKFPPLPYSSSKTGLVYDARMRFHAEFPDLMSNADDIHPEDPRRIMEIFEEIRQAGLVQGPEDADEETKDEQCWRIEARHAQKGEICLVHTPSHYAFISSLKDKPAFELKELSEKLDSIYFNNSTFECATLAAGGAIEACRAVVRGDVRNAIAIIRPPGHHAETDSPSGFCIFNNVPIAARVCQNDFPRECRKVVILDWDVHHGNGIQHAFYEDPNVLYISLHVYRDQKFYPNLPDGNLDYCGEGPGLGRNVNIPWADHGMGDAEYIYAFQQVVMPIATEFDPDLVIISAGFDAAEGDVLGGCHVTPACYGHMTHMLMRLAEGKIAVCLEGGYNLRSIARSALAVTRTLMLQPPDRLEADLCPKESAVQTIEQVKRQQSRYWKCLYPKQLDPSHPSFGVAQRLHEIIREWQSKMLCEEHHMSPLTVKRTGIAETFEHNIIATPEFMDPHPLLVIFHDPPEMMNNPDPITGKTELHNSWLADVNKRYINWAVQNGFQVIDVNIPKAVMKEIDDGSYVEADSNEARAAQTKELAGYVWENYIEPHEATQVFFLGIGAAYLGLVDLLSHYEKCREPDSVVECLIGFVSDTVLQSIKRNFNDDDIVPWYYAHSMIFVQQSHHVWDRSGHKKIRRKYGRLIQSSKDPMNDMLLEHQEEVREYLLAKKRQYEKENAVFNGADSRQGLRSPTLPSGIQAARFSGDVRQTPKPGQKLPPLGFFTAPSSRSPLKRSF
ncbi:putative histone deacetylase [Massariosphaeria phaeospora]|uniref:Histone deacetylase n=1 Tax=Massariosphaeria phaeospora TaxID=100035 RepID=A0A7C8MH15_9PLEO|nr:putative histone deacetylase [Massariosphaeria phaeospora]